MCHHLDVVGTDGPGLRMDSSRDLEEEIPPHSGSQLVVAARTDKHGSGAGRQVVGRRHFPHFSDFVPPALIDRHASRPARGYLNLSNSACKPFGFMRSKLLRSASPNHCSWTMLSVDEPIALAGDSSRPRRTPKAAIACEQCRKSKLKVHCQKSAMCCVLRFVV